MNPGEHLVDKQGDPTPYRVDELVATGDHHQIVRAHDETTDRDVALRAILYDTDSDEHVAARRSELKAQYNALEAVNGYEGAVEPIEWLEVDTSPVERVPEPLLVVQYVEGPTLHDWIVDEHPTGISPQRALSIIDQLAEMLEVFHDAGWLWRDFDPKGFVVQEDNRVCAVSPTAALRQNGVHTPAGIEINPNYTAPEIRDAPPENLRRPAADLYGLGALASFLLTGQPPRHRVESPLSYTAHQRLRELELEGLELLVAKLVQPMAKGRLSTARQLRQYCSVDRLPDASSEGFEDCKLPAPWEGLDIEDPEHNRGLNSKISAGPLVSMRSEDSNSTQTQEQPELDWKLVAVVAVAAAVVLIAIVL